MHIDFMAAAKDPGMKIGVDIGEGKDETVIHQVMINRIDFTKQIEIAGNTLKKLFGNQIKDMVQEASQIEVKDDESEKAAISMAGNIKTLIGNLDDKRKEIIKEPDQFVRKVNAMVKGFKDNLDPVLGGLRKKIGDHQYKKQIEQREREKKAREEEEARRKAIEEEAKAKGVEAPEMPPTQPVEKTPTVTRSEDGASAHIRTEWTFELIDINKVPLEYLILDEKKVKNMIKGGIREIPGLKIYEKPITVLKA